ncbi:hypothetical protein J8273_6739 [Carpediemonas membranifera]|uniref:Uncharacterized protein n=1 Tax=Carpediemonas membranifera TaxID=201153 RepID=A0A8J6B335_9EUKA|nr:hypothetical protein J8273_6739 [Carpediemonas membranifera]|eukprot:KAG9391937.1 hypothetical protein J8273_6739 [Carpediemonas membranifera]
MSVTALAKRVQHAPRPASPPNAGVAREYARAEAFARRQGDRPPSPTPAQAAPTDSAAALTGPQPAAAQRDDRSTDPTPADAAPTDSAVALTGPQSAAAPQGDRPTRQTPAQVAPTQPEERNIDDTAVSEFLSLAGVEGGEGERAEPETEHEARGDSANPPLRPPPQVDAAHRLTGWLDRTTIDSVRRNFSMHVPQEDCSSMWSTNDQVVATLTSVEAVRWLSRGQNGQNRMSRARWTALLEQVFAAHPRNRPSYAFPQGLKSFAPRFVAFMREGLGMPVDPALPAVPQPRTAQPARRRLTAPRPQPETILPELPEDLKFLPSPTEAGRIGKSKPSRKGAVSFVKGLINLLEALNEVPAQQKRRGLIAIMTHGQTVYKPAKKQVTLRTRTKERSAFTKASAGYYSSGLKILLSEDMDLSPTEVDEKLVELQAEPMADPRLFHPQQRAGALESYEVTPESVTWALDRLKADSAPGPSGLSFLHLKLAYRLRKHKFVAAVTPLINDIINGEPYTEILSHSRLVALPKGRLQGPAHCNGREPETPRRQGPSPRCRAEDYWRWCVRGAVRTGRELRPGLHG